MNAALQHVPPFEGPFSLGGYRGMENWTDIAEGHFAIPLHI